MKTKELIRQLMKADPTGEEEVCVGNTDIHFVERLAAYYDGPLQVLERDEDCEFYNIVGARYKRTGYKVNIFTLSICDAILNTPEIPVDYSELSATQIEATKKAHDDLRRWHKHLHYKLELNYFVKWAKDKAQHLTVDTEDVEALAKEFFNKHLSPEDPFPEGGIPSGHSYISARNLLWTNKYDVVLEDGFLRIVTIGD